MALQPSIDEVTSANQGGIGAVLTKPVMVDAILAAFGSCPLANRCS
jgi:hypothetical protein